jgi:DNA-binding MarR family transcriptional regulator
MDAILDDWRREMPDLDRPKFDFAKRVARLDQLQEEALSRCLAPWNLVIADFNVLSVLRTAGVPYELRPTDLRNRLVRTSAGIANIVKRLEQMKLVERIPDPVDKRSSWVRLTGDGIKVTEETIRAWNTVQEKMFAGVDPQLAQQASDILRTVLLAVGDGEPAASAARGGRDARGDARARRVLAGAGPADEEPGEPAALAQPPARGVGCRTISADMGCRLLAVLTIVMP